MNSTPHTPSPSATKAVESPMPDPDRRTPARLLALTLAFGLLGAACGLALFYGYWWAGFALLLVRGLIDHIDGFRARNYNERSTFGAVMDDVVDRWLGRAIRVVAKTVPHAKGALPTIARNSMRTAVVSPASGVPASTAPASMAPASTAPASAGAGAGSLQPASSARSAAAEVRGVVEGRRPLRRCFMARTLGPPRADGMRPLVARVTASP